MPLEPAHQSGVRVDLRDGYRIEVESLVLPVSEFGARLYRRHETPSGRVAWKQAGPMVVATTPEKAAHDLLGAMNAGLLTGVEVAG